MSANEFNEKYNKPPIWSPNSILLVSIIFSFIIGGIMNIISYKRLGYVQKAKKRLLFLILATIGIFVLSIFINMQSIIYGINMALVFFYYNDQKNLFENHIKLGGKKASVLIPLLVSILCIAIFVGGLYWADSSMNEDFELGFNIPYFSYVYKTHPDLYEAIRKNDKFKGKFTLDFTQFFDTSYGEESKNFAYNTKVQGSLNGKDLRIIFSFYDITEEYFKGYRGRSGKYYKSGNRLYEDAPYEEVYIDDQWIMVRTGKDNPWTTTSIIGENINKSYVYAYSSFKGHRMFSLNEIIRASKDDFNGLDKFKILKKENSNLNGTKVTEYKIVLYGKEVSKFFNPINDRISVPEPINNVTCILYLYVNSKNEIVKEKTRCVFGRYVTGVSYEINYSNIDEYFPIENPKVNVGEDI
ncbi:hypothetical protein [Anaeromicrobium sediminis]|uniref:Uncharacterized protein n=1 Tax=Anaeromicrobium sediminis TaxID=1478221 RepID=A0A267MGV8_9FIRM|nr:hypothetical protein [Anaeromicrobium sediminis]PAB58115.1 hypothetical protein CCE28_16705 [Anaeromicrobium sediminis]